MTRPYISTIYLILTALSAIGQTPQTFKLTDTVFKPGQVLITYSIHFTKDETEITEDSKPFLDSLAAFMKKYKEVVFEVGNYSEIQTQKQFAQRLTYNQEKLIAGYLITWRGIDPNRITPQGYDEARPVITKVHQKNKRVEFKIVTP